MNLYDTIQQAVAMIRQHTSATPRVGIILGSYLGGLVESMDVATTIEYQHIPHFPLSTVESHKGRLLLGTIGGCDVVVMQGRFHVYEGYSLQQITFPVRVMHALGARTLVVSNACGGMNPAYRKSDVMIIEDHINLLGDNPLIGPNDDRLGHRFPDMSEPYSRRLIGLAQQAAERLGHMVHCGTYVAVQGPNLETRAEYRFLRTIGADVVGMSTVPETIVARHMGMEVLGLSIITDECFPETLKRISLREILAAAATAEPVVASIIRQVLTDL